MPKISDETREQRRAQILDAAWRCFQREGVQGTRMEQIIAESGMAASAMYRYFRNKDDIILAAIATSLTGLAALLEPLVEGPDDGPPRALVADIARTIEGFSARSGFNLMSIAVHGWSEAQRNPQVRALLASFYSAFRDRLADKVRRWQSLGLADADAAPGDVAQALMSIVLGYVVQKSILPETDAASVSRGLGMLSGAARS